MNNNGTNKKLRIYLWVLYVLFVIQWLFLVSNQYMWVVCKFNIEKSSNIIDIWHQLSIVSKFFTIFVIYITTHVIVVKVIKFVNSIKENR